MRELDDTTFDAAIAGGPRRRRLLGAVVPAVPCDRADPRRARERPCPVARLNIDEYPEIAARFDVLSIPTVMLFRGGEARGAVVGARPRAHFERWLAEVLPAGELDGLAAQGQRDA